MKNYRYKAKSAFYAWIGMFILIIILLFTNGCCMAQIPTQYYYASDSCDFYLPDYSEIVEVGDNCCVDTFIQTPEPGTKLTPAEDITVILMGVDCAGNTSSMNFDVIVVDTIPPYFIIDTSGVIPPVEPPIEPPVDPEVPEDKTSIWFNDYENREVGDYTEAMVAADYPWHTYSSGRTSYMDDADNIAIEDHNGTNVMANYYIEGQYGLETGVNIFSVMTERDGWRKVYLSYNVMFKSPFDWGLGGKMPGLAAVPFAGPGSPDPDEGCSVRMMWQPDGKAIMYNYFHRDYDYDYGQGFGLDLQFEQDVWHHITISLEMGDTGVENGICEVYFDGIKVGSWTGNMTHEQAGFWVSAMTWSTFMGGGTPDYAPAWDQTVIIDDAETWYIEGEPRGPGPNDIRAYLRNFPKQ